MKWTERDFHSCHHLGGLMGTFHFTDLTVVRSETPAVRFEACSEFRDDPADEGSGAGSCAGCGWLADDHDLAGTPVAA